MEGSSFYILCVVIAICSLLVHALHKPNKANQQATARVTAAKRVNNEMGRETIDSARAEETHPRSYLDTPSRPTAAYLQRMEDLDKKVSAWHTFDPATLSVEKRRPETKPASAKDTREAFLKSQQLKGNKRFAIHPYSKKGGQQDRAGVS
jgi:FtsZ-interacting cell division protein ZipA